MKKQMQEHQVIFMMRRPEHKKKVEIIKLINCGKVQYCMGLEGLVEQKKWRIWFDLLGLNQQGALFFIEIV